MSEVHGLIAANVWLAWAVLIAAFALLAKSADMFVESSVAISTKMHLPKLVIGIVLVSFATTAPELSVSLTSAVRGNTGIAMGNAVGSVVCNPGLALAVCAAVSVSAIRVIPHVLRDAGVVFMTVGVLCFLFMVGDCTLDRWEGAVLSLAFFVYMAYIFVQHRRGVLKDDMEVETDEHAMQMPMWQLTTLFVAGLTGIIVASTFVVTSATTIARWLNIPDAIIAGTLVAFGTSIPEVATSITAARKRHGAIAIGNILGANIMNVCWVAGASGIVNPLVISRKELLFMFPWMLGIMMVALLMPGGLRPSEISAGVFTRPPSAGRHGFLVLWIEDVVPNSSKSLGSGPRYASGGELQVESSWGA